MVDSYNRALTEVLELLVVVAVLVMLNLLQTLLMSLKRYITKLLFVISHKSVILVAVAVTFEVVKLNVRENRLLSQDFGLGTYVVLCTGISIVLVLHSATTAFLGSSSTEIGFDSIALPVVKPIVRNMSTNTDSTNRGVDVDRSHCSKCRGYDEVLRRQLNDQLCVICQETVKCVVLLPCGHVCVCTDCSDKLNEQQALKCPVCRTLVNETAHVFI